MPTKQKILAILLSVASAIALAFVILSLTQNQAGPPVPTDIPAGQNPRTTDDVERIPGQNPAPYRPSNT